MLTAVKSGFSRYSRTKCNNSLGKSFKKSSRVGSMLTIKYKWGACKLGVIGDVFSEFSANSEQQTAATSALNHIFVRVIVINA
jgi:hypothetical protein